jgi:hypothetical protein
VSLAVNDRLKPVPPILAERGSALLIVFVFAAIVAIMLYREMPVAAFEARRQKEELLIDRGNEYKHAIKLYVKKIGQFPGSIDALENTNRIRFLRHKFDDPITGKNDWRLLHAGPNGIILDSKIQNTSAAPGSNPAAPGGSSSALGSTAFGNTTSNGAPNAPGANNSTSSFGSSNSPSGFSSFSSSFSSSSDNSAANGGPTLAPVPQRGPAIAAAGSGAVPPIDPNAPVPAPNPQIAGTVGDPQSQMRGLLSNQNPVASQTVNAQQGTGVPANSNSFGSSSFGSGSSGSGSSFGSSSFGSNAATGTGATGNTAAGGAPSGSTFGQGTFGQGTMGKITGGSGIAGVASIAAGKTIKTVNDQTDFSLWEFYYDMAKEASTAMAGAMTGTGSAGGSGQPGTQAQPTGAGSSFGGSSFGGSSGGSSFGGNSGGSSFGGSNGGSGFGGSNGGSSFGGSSSFGGNSGSSFGGTSTTTAPGQTPVTPSTPVNPNPPQN